MGRYVNCIKVPVDPNTLTERITNYMTMEGFKLINYNGQMIWKKGSGWTTGPQYLGILYGSDYVQIDAFIKYALFPGVYIGEMGIDGFFGALPKGLLTKRVRALEAFIFSLWQQPAQ